MIIDCHVHIFPEAVCSGRECYFSEEKAFELLYDAPRSKLVTADTLISMMDAESVDRSIVFGFPWKSADTFRRHNDYIMESVARFPDRLTGFSCFDAAHPEAAREAERCLESGLAGVGELAFYESGIDDNALHRLDPVMAICRERGSPLLIHTNEPIGHDYPGKSPIRLDQIYALARRFPDNRLVLAHWGGGLFLYHLMKKETRETLKNVWYDTAASPYLYRSDIWTVAVQAAGAERILFGSDYPLIPPSRYFKDMADGGIAETEKRRICGENAAELLGINSQNH